MLDNLSVQHTQKAERLSFLRGAVSPLKRMPPEILGRIFTLCSDGKPVVLPPNYSSGPRYPWTLGQVSSYWRKVLWDTPDVWRSLEVGMIISEDDTTTSTALEIFSRVNTRLSLFTREEIGVNNPISTFILKFADRFQHISLCATIDFLFSFLALPSNSLKVLASIEFIFDGCDMFLPNAPNTATVLLTAINLTKATFKKKEIGWRNFPIDVQLLPWEQLTEISFTCLALTYGDAHSILRQCKRLVSCTLHLENVPEYKMAPHCERIVMSTLRTLEVFGGGYPPFLWEKFLSPLELPTLKSLLFRAADSLGDDTLSSFLAHSRFTLEILTLRTRYVQYVEPEFFYTLLGQLPTLRELAMLGHCISPSVFSLARSHTQSESQLLSKVQVFACRIESPGLLAYADFMERCVGWETRGMTDVVLGCRDEPEFEDALQHFSRFKPAWEMSGRKVTVERLEMEHWNERTDRRL
ncbi:hypothetical protein BDZ94DRAFT_892686 [Collybia nuda]|uniref:F-box domain-containing protein n=1 Tax=Collybia nuda TaxID=64659 RepID=A0A9P6CH61_9AGAR|nr:hypothetical protein BDZ94DRAFT_892686 [Collybia nuda]